MATGYMKFERDDCTEVEVEYTITSVTPATYWKPAEGGEVEIVSVTGPDGPVKWTDEEDEKWCARAAEDHEWDDGPDPDDEYERARDE